VVNPAQGAEETAKGEKATTLSPLTLDQLRSEFNNKRGKTRIITLLSPT
jgi:hypothetical protein